MIKIYKTILMISFDKLPNKEIIFKNIVNSFSTKKEFKKDDVIEDNVNYNSKKIDINENISLEFFNIESSKILFEKRKDILSEKIYKKALELIIKSDLIVWIIDYNKIDGKEAILSDFLYKNKKKYVIFIEKEIEDYNINKLKSLKILENSIIYTVNNLFTYISKLFTISNSLLISPKNKNLDKDNLKNDFYNSTILLMGLPNSGKSTLMNLLLKKERSIVSELPGTTQKPVVDSFSLFEKEIKLIDTAGVENRQTLDNLSIYNVFKESKIVLLVIDITKDITNQIAFLAGLTKKFFKTTLLLLNKTDLVNKTILSKKKKELESKLKFIKYSPIIPISSLKRYNITLIYDKIKEIFEKKEITFGEEALNLASETINNKKGIKTRGKLITIKLKWHNKGFYHSFGILFSNIQLVNYSQRRFIVNQIRDYFKLSSLPIKLIDLKK